MRIKLSFGMDESGLARALTQSLQDAGEVTPQSRVNRTIEMGFRNPIAIFTAWLSDLFL